MTSNGAAAFLASIGEPTRQLLATSVELRDFLQTAGTLTLSDRRLIVDQAIVLLEQNYVHLPFKVAMHAINPVQRLRLLRIRLDRQTAETMDPEWEFHAEVSAIFNSLRDLHTTYLLPDPFAGKFAFLPFLVEEYRDETDPHYVVSHLVEGYSAPGFEPGAEVIEWSGIPIDRAVDLNAARFPGSNPAARRSRGVQFLTLRNLRIHLPPDEEWVTIGYVGVDGSTHELREKWLVVANLPPFETGSDAVSPSAAAMALDIGTEELNRARRMLFAPQSFEAERTVRASGRLTLTAEDAELLTAEDAELPTALPGVFRARRVTTPSGTFGHLRIFTFYREGDQDAFVEEFVAEFVRLVGLLPQNGLIVDVRGNAGGNILASERSLQTLSPRRIEPEPVQFISSNLNLTICRKHKDNPVGIDLGPWFPSLDQAVETGAAFSGAFPITRPDEANAIGQVYQGPVLLVTDARSYSATDIFAAGFQDHGIGPVLGVDENTGAGGAVVWPHGLLKWLLEMPTMEPGSPYRDLPKEAGMGVAIGRTLRVGPLAGTPVEGLGVTPDIRYDMTRRDLLNDNVDLLNRAGEILAAVPARTLAATATAGPNGSLVVQLQGANLERADVFVDDRPRASVDLAEPAATVTVDGVPGASSVRVEGYAAGELAATVTIAVGSREVGTRRGDGGGGSVPSALGLRRLNQTSRGGRG